MFTSPLLEAADSHAPVTATSRDPRRSISSDMLSAPAPPATLLLPVVEAESRAPAAVLAASPAGPAIAAAPPLADSAFFDDDAPGVAAGAAAPQGLKRAVAGSADSPLEPAKRQRVRRPPIPAAAGSNHCSSTWIPRLRRPSTLLSAAFSKCPYPLLPWSVTRSWPPLPPPAPLALRPLLTTPATSMELLAPPTY